MQVLNDGADEEDFKQLLEILKGFGEVEVLYEREGYKYMREVKDFFKKFEDVSSPLYSDYEAISSDEVSIVEKGEIDSTPTMQNALKPKKQKTVTDIIHDQLGPGLDPDMFLDVIRDDSKNDEDSNRAK